MKDVLVLLDIENADDRFNYIQMLYRKYRKHKNWDKIKKNIIEICDIHNMKKPNFKHIKREYQVINPDNVRYDMCVDWHWSK